MSQGKTLARLHQELTTLESFDRLHDLAVVHDSVETKAYALREIRRSQVTAGIGRVKARRAKYATDRFLVSGGFVLICALGYASLHYLFR